MTESEHVYQAEVAWIEQKIGWLSLEGKPELKVAVPPEFGGPEGLTTPEDLFVSSAAACFMSTFLTMAEKIRADWTGFSCRAEGRLGPDQSGGFVFTRIDLFPQIRVAPGTRIKRVNRAVELAKKFCPVANSMKTEVRVHPEVLEE